MTLEQLKYFCAIVEQGSFRAAAESVFRSQSSLSVSIQKLEQSLGVSLFKRDGYRPTLTPEGRTILQKAKVMLKKEHELHALASHLAQGHKGEIKLAVSGIVPIEPIIAVLNQLKTLYPETSFTLLVENLAGTMERLTDGVADIALTDSFEWHQDFESVMIDKVTFVNVVPSQSVWAKQATTISHAALENETLIIVRDTSTHSPRLSKGVVDGAPQWVVNDFTTKKGMLISGTGWGRMPLHLVHDALQQGLLTQLTSPDFQPLDIPIYMVRHKRRVADDIEALFWQMLSNTSLTTRL